MDAYSQQPQPVVMKLTNEMLLHVTLAGQITSTYREQIQNFADKVFATVLDSYQKTGSKVKFLTNLSNPASSLWKRSHHRRCQPFLIILGHELGDHRLD